MSEIWDELREPAPREVTLGEHVLRAGSRVRLKPRPRGDVFDDLLAGRSAIVEGLDQSVDGTIHVAVTIEDDPGRDLGEGRYPGHRFFFSLDELEPLGEPLARGSLPRILVAGIGNVFLGDDGFGVAVAQQLAAIAPVPGVDVRDYGIRGMDLAYALQREYDAVVFLDAAPRGRSPGTLSVIDATVDAAGPAVIDTHGMDPVKVLALARALGRVPPRVLVVACEPERIISPDAGDEMSMTMSDVVMRAVPEAVELSRVLIGQLVAELQAPRLAAD